MDHERTSAELDSDADRPAPSPRPGDPDPAAQAAPGAPPLRPVDRRTRELRAGERGFRPDGRLQPGDVPPPAPAPTNIYRARRPAVAVLLVVPAIAVGLLLIRALAISAFGDPFSTGGVIASSAGLASLPLLVAGIYGLVTGAAHGAEQWGFRVWARPPLAYLLVGLAFVIAAGTAVS